MTDFLSKIREQKIKINDDTEIAVFDITASFIGIYMISKYAFEVENPIIISTISLIPISYIVHQFFEVETPLNNLINGKNKNDYLQAPVPTDNNLQQSNLQQSKLEQKSQREQKIQQAQQAKQEHRSRTEQPDIADSNLQMTSYEKMDVKKSPIISGINRALGF